MKDCSLIKNNVNSAIDAFHLDQNLEFEFSFSQRCEQSLEIERVLSIDNFGGFGELIAKLPH